MLRGMMLGSLSWGVLADVYGRRLAFLATSVCCLGFGLASAFATSFYWLAAARFGVGVGVEVGIGSGWVVISVGGWDGDWRGAWGV